MTDPVHTTPPPTPASYLAKLSLSGFTSIRSAEALTFGPINVLIGPNGAGKSNLIAFFRLISLAFSGSGNLELGVTQSGGANALLYHGAATTLQLEADLELRTARGTNAYHMRLFHGAPDRFIFANERYRFIPDALDDQDPDTLHWTELGSGHTEARIIERAELNKPTARTILGLLRGCVVHQFHNTSARARVRQHWSAQDGHRLKEDAANLAPFLWKLQTDHPHSYRRIRRALQRMLPFLDDFIFQPNSAGMLMLQWRERGSDAVFSAHQASDGMLRLIALTALLLQPRDHMPTTLILDEPELGLHPSAIALVAGMIRSVSTHTQVLLATQSTALLDHFEPADVLVTERQPTGETTYRRLDPAALERWLEDYSLAELWTKNVLGGRPD